MSGIAYPVDQSFLSALTAGLWSTYGGGCVAIGRAHYFPAHPSGTWALVSRGLTLSQSTYTSLHGATAQSDGSYIEVSGAPKVLVDMGDGTCEVSDPPPPPPPSPSP